MLTCIELHFVEYTMDPAVKRRCQLNDFHFSDTWGKCDFWQHHAASQNWKGGDKKRKLINILFFGWHSSFSIESLQFITIMKLLPGNTEKEEKTINCQKPHSLFSVWGASCMERWWLPRTFQFTSEQRWRSAFRHFLHLTNVDFLPKESNWIVVCWNSHNSQWQSNWMLLGVVTRRLSVQATVSGRW